MAPRMARALVGEEFLLFGREPDISADPPGEIPGGDLGDAHLLTPKGDGNGTGNLNRLLALPDGYRWRARRKPLEELAFVFCNDGARLQGELFLAGARKPVSPQTQCFPWTRRALVMSTCSPRIITGMPTPAIALALSTIEIALWQVPMDILVFIFPPWGEPSELFLQAKAAEPEGSQTSTETGSTRPWPSRNSGRARPS